VSIAGEEDAPSHNTLNPGDALELTCMVRALNTSNIQYVWSFQSHVIGKQRKYRKASVTEDDSGLYLCQAKQGQKVAVGAFNVQVGFVVRGFSHTKETLRIQEISREYIISFGVMSIGIVCAIIGVGVFCGVKRMKDSNTSSDISWRNLTRRRTSQLSISEWLSLQDNIEKARESVSE
jgi:hypothetical protein